jgi:hypothetical protein
MSAFSDYMENEIINFFLRGNPNNTTPPGAVYLALYTSNPNDDNSGVEVTGGSYVRQLITFSDPNDGVSANENLLTFPVATATWGTISHVGVMSAQSGGQLLYYGAVTPSNTVAAGGRMEFPIGSIQASNQ